MPSVRQYLRNKKKREEQSDDINQKIKKHRVKIFVRIALSVCVLGVIGVIAYVIISNFSFDNYSVQETIKRQDVSNTHYEEFQDNIIRYSKDGVSYINGNGEEFWNQTYEMQNPMIDVNGESAAIADQSGNHVFIFNKDGLQGEFETVLPIEKVRVSNQGLTAILLKDEGVNWIYYYDKGGTVIAQNRASMANTGFPIDLDVSDDGLRIMVSYLHVTNGAMTTKIAFYNFGSVGQEKTDNLVSATEYPDMVSPTVRFLNNSISAAVGDDRILLYEGTEIPALKSTIELKNTIKSVFFNEKRIGVVTVNEDSAENNYKLTIYNTAGKEIMQSDFKMNYSQIKFYKDKILIYGSSEFTLINMNGSQQFSGSLDMGVKNIIPTGGFYKYSVIYDAKIEKIRLK